MILYFVITILICVFAYIDWKRTVLIWIPFSMLFNQSVCIKYTSPAITISLAVNVALMAILYIQKEKLQIHLTKRAFLFEKVFYAYLISYGMSMLFSIVPLTTVLTGTIKYFINTFGIVYLFHLALNTKKDLSLFIKATFIAMLPIIMLGLFEAVFHDNPWLDRVYLSAPNVNYILGKMYYVPPFLSYTGDLSTRFGLVRCYSFFNIHIAFGCACLLQLFLFLYFNSKNYYDGKLLSKTTYLSVSLLCIVGIILSNSKTPMVGLPFLVLAAVPYSKFFSTKGIACLAFIIIAVFVVMNYNENIFNNFRALFDDKMMEEGGGSSISMRAKQYEVGLSLFYRNPLFGNGIDSLSYIKGQTSRYADILGAESSWLKILPQQGLLGAIVYLFLYSEMYKHLKISAGRNTALFFCLGLILMETATGIMDFSIFGPIIVAIERYYQLTLKEDLKKKILIYVQGLNYHTRIQK